MLARPGRVFAVSFALVFLSIAAWSLATPLYASPDEPAHVVHAVALDHGQLIGTPVGGPSSAIIRVTVPASISDGNRYRECFSFTTSVAASCARALTTSSAPTSTETSAGRYPPLYYAVVGLPSLASTTTSGVYLMRLVSAALSALFVALAVMSVCRWSRRRFMLVGILLALTPMTMFMSAMVNPNGAEIAAAICLWAAGLVLVLERADDPPRGLLAVVTASAVLLMLSRGISPLWVLLIAAVLAILAGWRRALGLLRSPSLRLPIVIVILAGVFAVVWIVAAHANDLQPGTSPLPSKSGLHLLLTIWSMSGGWLQQMIGVFGWLDTPAPLATYLVWYGLIGLVLLLALSGARARGVVALLVLIALVLLVPIAISYHEAHRLADFWQGRYTLPLAAGIPILATALIDGGEALGALRARLTTLMCVAVGVADFAAFYTAQRRYASGLPGPVDIADGRWGPPLGNVAMALWALLVTALLVGFVASTATSAPASGDGPGPADGAPLSVEPPFAQPDRSAAAPMP